MKTETAFYKNPVARVVFGKLAVPSPLKGIPFNSIEFREIPSNSTPKSSQVVELKASLSTRYCGVFSKKFYEVYISA